MFKKLFLLTLLSGLVAAEATATAPSTYRDIVALRAMNRRAQGIRPMSDGRHYTILENNSVVRYNYADDLPGQTLLASPGDDFPIVDYQFSPDGTRMLVARGAEPIYRRSYTTRYYLSDEEGLRPILTEMEGTRDASFSPDGRTIAFSSGNDLYLYDIEADSVRRITRDGRWNETINGTTDWVYEEECAFTRAYAFSPDGRRLAFLRFDESQVPLFEMMRFDGTLYNRAYTFKYPKAGDRNSEVDLFVYDLDTERTERIDAGPDRGQYLLQPLWTPDGRLCFQRLNRRQNHYELVLCLPDGTQRVIFDEQSPTYVDHTNKPLQFLPDGRRFLIGEETSTGFRHLYLYSIDKGLLRPVTQGEWEVTDFVGLRGDKVYYLSTEGSPLRRDLYRIGLNGKGKQRLTPGDGFYSIAPSADLSYYICEGSNSTTPSRTEVFTADGRPLRTLADNAELRERLAQTDLPVREFFTFTTERGDELNGYLLKPADFDPAKRYPVLMTQYSGPGSQQVSDRWAPDWESALTAHGYVVACVDPRGTGFRGEAFRKATYGNLGALEVEDQISAARYLARQSWVDADRIGIYGWSFGGFMALGCACKGDGLFKMAIAVAPVTSWRYYDSIYTENYNGLPEDYPEGYDGNSPINLAHLLRDDRTRLLLIHGTADDNVHFQNAMEMARALNRWGKRYDMMVYPDQNHSMMPDDTINVREKMIEYTLQNL
ncbi:MAG: S9 family peptidase [Alistipes sp.]|nr:S9 family peptidase [Alistipes sp.]